MKRVFKITTTFIIDDERMIVKPTARSVRNSVRGLFRAYGLKGHKVKVLSVAGGDHTPA